MAKFSPHGFKNWTNFLHATKLSYNFSATCSWLDKNNNFVEYLVKNLEGKPSMEQKPFGKATSLGKNNIAKVDGWQIWRH